jgi:hypothetical protein
MRLLYFLTTGAQSTEFSRKFLLRTLDIEPTAVWPASVIETTSKTKIKNSSFYSFFLSLSFFIDFFVVQKSAFSFSFSFPLLFCLLSLLIFICLYLYLPLGNLIRFNSIKTPYYFRYT